MVWPYQSVFLSVNDLHSNFKYLFSQLFQSLTNIYWDINSISLHFPGTGVCYYLGLLSFFHLVRCMIWLINVSGKLYINIIQWNPIRFPHHRVFLLTQISGHSPIKILEVPNISNLQDNFCIYWCEFCMPLMHMRSKCPVTKFGQPKPCIEKYCVRT